MVTSIIYIHVANFVEHKEMYSKKKPHRKDTTSFVWRVRNDFILLFSKEPKLVNMVQEIQRNSWSWLVAKKRGEPCLLTSELLISLIVCLNSYGVGFVCLVNHLGG